MNLVWWGDGGEVAGVANRGVRHLGHGSCHQPFWHAAATRRNVGHVDEDEVEFKWVSPRYGAMAWENVRRVTCLNFDEVVLRRTGVLSHIFEQLMSSLGQDVVSK